MYEPSSFDVIMLIHHATLELYGLAPDLYKSMYLAALLTDIAEGRRTLLESDNEEFGRKFRAEFDKHNSGITFEEFMHDARMRERNAARRLNGLPPVTE